MNNDNHNTECKRTWKDEYLKWVRGFANAQGEKICWRWKHMKVASSADWNL